MSDEATNPRAFDLNAAGIVSRRKLPHWRQDRALYFVTFRLADSLPAERLAELRAMRLANAGRRTGFQTPVNTRRTGFQPVSEGDRQDDCSTERGNGLDACSTEQGHRLEACATEPDDDPTELLRRIDRWLDAGHGSCCLARAEAAGIVENALRYFDGIRYRLGAYVVMPNHVHVLVMPLPDHELSNILHSWKSFTANQINKALNRCGVLWQDESFDHIVRDDAAARNFAKYIEDNAASVPPGQARLGRGGLVLT